MADLPGAVPPSPPPYEKSDARIRILGWAGLAIAILTAGAFAGMFALFAVLDHYHAASATPPNPLAASRQSATAPRLQVDPPRQKLELRQLEDQLLGTYGWVDREKGLARIPIDRAIAILAARGLPARTVAQP